MDDFLTLIQNQDIVFSARAHGVILASILGVPSVCLGTSKKLIEVSKFFPKSVLLLKPPITAAKLQEHFERTIKNYEQLIPMLREEVAINHNLARSSWTSFINKI